jgi:pyruvate/2-oxoacid:ferredoxin oxidoreductase alpha subunit
MATASSTSRSVVEQFRRQGIPLGRLGLRMFRPFPAKQIVETLRGKTKVVVLDRNCSYGSDGIAFSEIKSALYSLPQSERPEVYGYISGLGGRDLTPVLIRSMVERSLHETPQPHSVWMK